MIASTKVYKNNNQQCCIKLAQMHCTIKFSHSKIIKLLVHTNQHKCQLVHTNQHKCQILNIIKNNAKFYLKSISKLKKYVEYDKKTNSNTLNPKTDGQQIPKNSIQLIPIFQQMQKIIRDYMNQKKKIQEYDPIIIYFSNMKRKDRQFIIQQCEIMPKINALLNSKEERIVLLKPIDQVKNYKTTMQKLENLCKVFINKKFYGAQSQMRNEIGEIKKLIKIQKIQLFPSQYAQKCYFQLTKRYLNKSKIVFFAFQNNKKPELTVFHQGNIIAISPWYEFLHSKYYGLDMRVQKQNISYIYKNELPANFLDDNNQYYLLESGYYPIKQNIIEILKQLKVKEEEITIFSITNFFPSGTINQMLNRIVICIDSNKEINDKYLSIQSLGRNITILISKITCIFQTKDFNDNSLFNIQYAVNECQKIWNCQSQDFMRARANEKICRFEFNHKLQCLQVYLLYAQRTIKKYNLKSILCQKYYFFENQGHQT